MQTPSWKRTPKLSAAYLALFWLQYVLGMAFVLANQYSAWLAGAPIGWLVIETLTLSGIIGVGAAMSSFALILTVEAISMVLAEMIKASRYKKAHAEGVEEGIAKGVAIGREEGVEEGIVKGVAIGREEGVEEGIVKGVAIGREEEREENKKRMRAWARERGISEDDLPLD